MDGQTFSILSTYSRPQTNQSRMNNNLRDHALHPVPRQYTTVPEFQDNYGNESPPSMLQNIPRYPDSSRTVKEEQTYLYSTAPTDFRGEMDLNVHHPTQLDHITIRYPASQNPYPSDLNTSNAIRMASSRLETSEARLPPGPAETGSADFRYQIPALQPHLLHPQRHQHGSLPHHQHVLNHAPAFFSPSMSYSPSDQEHSSPGGGTLDRQPQTPLSSLDYDSRDSHTQHVSVPGIVYDHEPMTVPGHSQQGVRRDATLNHRGSLASLSSNNSGSGSYHTPNLPASSIPMSNNKHNRGTASSMNTSMPGAHTSSSFSMGPCSSSRWACNPSCFDMAGSTAGTTSVHSQVPAPASTSALSLRPILRHSKSENRSSPEDSFTQDDFHLRPSTSAQTLSSSYSAHSHTNSPSPRLSDNESNVGRRFGSELFSQDDRESDQDVGTVVRMSEDLSERKEVIRAGEEGEAFSAPLKKKKKSKMHCCEICSKKFPRPSGLRTHMNTHSNAKPFACGFPGCMRSFGVRSNAKRHLRTHGVMPTPTVNPNSADAPYIVGFCPPMIGLPQSSPQQQSQIHSIEGGGDSGNRLLGGNANIHTQGQGQSDVQPEMSSVPILQHEMNSAPKLKLRWMPPSLTARTNAGRLREVRDKQQTHWMGFVAEEEDREDEDDLLVDTGSSINVVRRMGGEYDMGRDDIIDDGDEVEFGENVPRLNYPLRPVVPSSSTTSAVAASGIRLTVSRPMECMYSPPTCSESPTQGTHCRSSSSSSRTFASISPVSSTSFAGSNSSLSPPSTMVPYVQHEIDITSVGGGGVYTTSTENISREYGVQDTRTEEQSPYFETGSRPYHPSSQHPKYFR